MNREQLSNRMASLANRRVLLASGALVLAIASVMFATSGRFSLGTIAQQCGRPAPDVRWATSATGVEDFLTSCGTAGRSAYRDLQLLDLVYPAAMGLFLASALTYSLPKLQRGRDQSLRVLAVVPLLAAAFDYLENLGAWVVLARYPDQPTWAASLFSIASPAKQALNWTAGLLLVAGLIAMGIRSVRSRTGGSQQRDAPANAA